MTPVPSKPDTVRSGKLPVETILLIDVCILVAVGLLMVFDASYPLSLTSKHVGYDPYYFGKHQLLGLVGGIAAMSAAIWIGYAQLRRNAGLCAVMGAVLLVLVWAPHLGVNKLHASRWIHFGTEFQPSEIAKLCLVIYLASALTRKRYSIRHLSNATLAPLAVAGLYMWLIDREPDLGTTIVVFATVLTMLYMAGARPRHLVTLVLLAFFLFLAKGGLMNGQAERIKVFMAQGAITKGAGYQTYHSKLAIGSGEIFGVGWGGGHEKYYLPEANSDFIFATVSEELGLVGSTVVISLFMVLSWCGLKIASQTEDPFGRLLALGLTGLLTWQTVINIAVVTLSIPATGVPLPFISYGSTSLAITLAIVGILVSIAHDPKGLHIPGRSRP